MESMCALIPHVAMKEEVGSVLVQAFEKCCLEEGYGDVDSHHIYNPVRIGYHNLFFNKSNQGKDGQRQAVCNKRYERKWHDCVCKLEFSVGDADVMEEEQKRAEIARWLLE
jgi:hypothetical protein